MISDRVLCMYSDMKPNAKSTQDKVNKWDCIKVNRSV